MPVLSPRSIKDRIIAAWASPQWRYFSRFLDRKPAHLFLITVGALISGLMVFPVTALIRYMVDDALPSAELKGLFLAALALFALRFFSSTLMLGIRAKISRAISRSIGSVRSHLSNLIVFNLSRDAYTHVDLVKIHTQVIEDTSRLDRLFNAILARLIPSIIAGAVLCIIMIYLSSVLFLILLGLAPLMLLITKALGSKVRVRVRAFQKMFEVYSKRTLFVLQHLDLVRVHANEEREARSSSSAINKLSEHNYDMNMSYAFHGYAQNTLMHLYSILFIMAGGGLVAYEHLSFGGFISFFVVANFLNGHLSRVIDVWPDIIAGRESTRKLYELAHGIHQPPYRGEETVDFDGQVEFSNVSFQFTENNPRLLENINLKLSPGHVTGLTGPNGCGKTTITSLLMGFYRPQTGRITASGIDYNEIDFRSLRPQIGVVMQNPIFFQGSVLENITYGQQDLDPETVEQFARIALASEFIEKLPDGYQTDIGEHGVCLSGGQRQRLAIVRALCSQPKLLILDEVTNHMDQPSILQLLENLGNLPTKPAILMIGHKPDEMSFCDDIYHIENLTLHEFTIKQPSYS